MKKDVVLNVMATRPVDCATTMSKPITDVFEWPTQEFMANETYYVGAMYETGYYGSTINYGSPSISETPLFVAASEIADFTPGEEIHCHIHDYLY